jgi:hypothetical protein
MKVMKMNAVTAECTPGPGLHVQDSDMLLGSMAMPALVERHY